MAQKDRFFTWNSEVGIVTRPAECGIPPQLTVETPPGIQTLLFPSSRPFVKVSYLRRATLVCKPRRSN